MVTIHTCDVSLPKSLTIRHHNTCRIIKPVSLHPAVFFYILLLSNVKQCKHERIVT
jgi:hypothetical protein